MLFVCVCCRCCVFIVYLLVHVIYLFSRYYCHYYYTVFYVCSSEELLYQAQAQSTQITPLEIDILFQLANIKHQTGYCWSAVCCVCVCVNHRSSGHAFRWRLTSCSSWPTTNTRLGTVGQPCVVCVSIIVHLATPSAGD